MQQGEGTALTPLHVSLPVAVGVHDCRIMDASLQLWHRRLLPLEPWMGPHSVHPSTLPRTSIVISTGQRQLSYAQTSATDENESASDRFNNSNTGLFTMHVRGLRQFSHWQDPEPLRTWQICGVYDHGLCMHIASAISCVHCGLDLPSWKFLAGPVPRLGLDKMTESNQLYSTSAWRYDFNSDCATRLAAGK